MVDEAFAGQCRAALDDIDFSRAMDPLSLSSRVLGDIPGLGEIPTLRRLADFDKTLLRKWQTCTPRCRMSGSSLISFRSHRGGRHRAGARIAVIEDLASQCGALALIDYDFLYDETRHLLPSVTTSVKTAGRELL